LTQQDSGIISVAVLSGHLNRDAPHVGILREEDALCVERRFKSRRESEHAEITEVEAYDQTFSCFPATVKILHASIGKR